jgi:hypothetical protein
MKEQCLKQSSEIREQKKPQSCEYADIFRVLDAGPQFQVCIQFHYYFLLVRQICEILSAWPR